ncbi:hypothetical protein [Massilia sp.]|uniref:hypothetical protein n=1 Tax=Massilia sp. TaxID=1882437 RepID=UPI00289AE02C|nr:hypothetical protein [Massilia sp.]
METKTYKYRLIFQFAYKGIINVPDAAEPYLTQLEYGQDDGNSIILRADGKSFHEAKQFKLMRGGFPSPKEAWEEARECLLALSLVAAELGLGFKAGDINVGEYEPAKALPGQDTIFSKNTFSDQESKKKTRAVPHKLGITIIEELDKTHGITSIKMSAQIAPFSLTPAGLISAMCLMADQEPRIDTRSSLALEIYHQSFFEQSRTAFLMLIQMLETLSATMERSPKVIAFIELLRSETIQESKKAKSEQRDADHQSLERIASSLSDLKKESITQSIVKLAEECCSKSFIDGGSVASLIRKCYKIRGSLTHKGITGVSEKDFLNYLAGLRNVCREILWVKMRFAKLNLHPDDISPTVINSDMTQF